jgi:hypothetical protein
MSAVRVPDASYQTLRRLAEGGSMQAVLVEAIEDLRRKRLLEATNKAFAALRSNPESWREEEQERSAWDTTLGDGLESD